MKQKKTLVALLALLMASVSAIGFTACDISGLTSEDLSGIEEVLKENGLSLEEVQAKLDELGYVESMDEFLMRVKEEGTLEEKEIEEWKQGHRKGRGPNKGDKDHGKPDKDDKEDHDKNDDEKGIWVEKIYIDENGDLIIELGDGTKINLGNVFDWQDSSGNISSEEASSEESSSVEESSAEISSEEEIYSEEISSSVEESSEEESSEQESSSESEEERMPSEGLEYTLSDDGTYYIVTGIGTCEDTEIVIPDTYEGLPVISIGGGIGGGAFAGGSSLTKVVIGDRVASIGEKAFVSCSSLMEVVISNSVTSIGASAFAGCVSLTKIALPAGVMSIGEYAFNGCLGLAEVVIGDSVTSIGMGAFDGCYSLTKIVIPDSVTSIGGGAFAGCISLTEVAIPNSVTSIGSGPFAWCIRLMSITVDESNANYFSLNGNLYNKEQTELIQYAMGKTDMFFAIPDGVSRIGDFAFNRGNMLTWVVIPDSVMWIGNNAFAGCSSLTSIKFKGTIEQWNDITKGDYWNYEVPATEVVCSNGTVTL